MTNKNYNFTTEEQFTDYVLKELKNYLTKTLSKFKLKIDKHKKILKDVTVVSDRLEGYKLALGFSDNDVVIFKEMNNSVIKNLKCINGIELNSIRNEKEFIIPFVVFELKVRGVTSHAIITYSHTAMEIKDKFPFCQFYMIIFESNKKHITIMRQGKNFDRILILNKRFYRKDKHFYPRDSIKDIVPSIIHHLDKLAEQEILI